jgi:O-antigen/teichoic acid export membrane protein
MNAPAPAAVPSPAMNLVTGTASRYLLLAINIGLGVVLLPFTVSRLGMADYGLWMLVASMTYYFQLLDLGYGSGLVRHVADADARHDLTLVNQILSTFVVVYAGIGLLSVAGTAGIITWVIPRFPNLTAEQMTRAQAILALLGVRIAVGFPMTVFGAATMARQRFALNNTVAIVVALVNGAVTYLVLSMGHGLVTLVAATTTVSLASYGAYAWTARQAMPGLRIRPALFNSRLVRDVTTFSVYVFVIDIAIQVGFNLDNLVIGAALGTSAVAVYAVAMRLADYQRQLCNQFNGLLFPVVVRLGAAGQAGALRSVLIDGTRVALMLVVGVTVCVVGFASPLVAHWMGPGFDGSLVPLYVLAMAGLFLVGRGPLGYILLGTGRHRLVAFVSLGEALANLALSIALVRRYGLLGVALGTAIPVALASLFILLPAACRQAGLGVASFGRLVAAAPLVGAVPAIAATAAFRAALPPDSLPLVFGEGAIVGAIYLLTVCTLGLDRAVRARYFDYLRQLASSLTIGRIGTAQVTAPGVRA